MAGTKKRMDDLEILDAALMWRNFSGAAGKNNAEGDRNFCVRLKPDDAVRLKEAGWNVKSKDPIDPQDDKLYWLPVKVEYANFPPKIVLVTQKNKTPLTEDKIKKLDAIEMQKVDLIINPYQWTYNGNSGVKAYLKIMYFTMKEDPLAARYADIPDSFTSGLTDDDD